jgi:nucleotide-binding universal stress UspA family protein
MATPTATHDPATADGLDDPVYRYDRILVAIDDSRESRLALGRAVDLARRSNARLDLLLSAVVPSTTYWGGAFQPIESNELYYAKVLRTAAASVEGVPVTSYLARGNAAARILEHAAKYGCDLIVMGSRGRNRAVAALLGSTSHAVLHAATVPVLIVHADGEHAESRGFASQT